MPGHRQRAFAASLLIVLLVAGCSPPAAAPGHEPEEPVIVVEGVDGANDRLTLSAKAAERLAIETATVQVISGDGESRSAIPYAAVVYEADGTTWAYQNVDGLTFVRQPIEVERIDGDWAFLSDGLSPEALVVTVGAAELLGVEHGVGGGH